MKALFRYALVATVAGSAIAAQAITLSDLNSQIDVNSSGHLTAWDVDGSAVDLYEGRYYIRVGAGTNVAVETLGTTTITQIAPNIAEIIHENASVQFRQLVTLTGSPLNSLASDVAEQVKVTNKTGAPLRVELFQYNDFDLDGSLNDRAAVLAPDYLKQWDANSPKQPRIDHTVTSTAGVALWKVGAWPSVRNYISGTTNDLDNQASPFGPGDATYAFQYGLTLSAAGQPTSSLLVGSDKVYQAVPEPASMMALGLGLAAVAARRRRK